MINEEIARRTLQLNIGAGKNIVSILEKEIRKLMMEAKKHGGLENYIKKNGSEVKLKDITKKGQLEEIKATDFELKELKKLLNKHGVKFSVMKDKETGKHSVFFQAKDIKVMDRAFRDTLAKLEKREAKKESIHQKIEKFKELAKNTISKDKVKNKQKEQSL